MTNTTTVAMTEPPNKKVKGHDLIDLINDCYDMHFRNAKKTQEEVELLKQNRQKIREILEQINSSSDVSFGPTKTTAKINWGKCLGVLLEDGQPSFGAIQILSDKLNPGGGLL